MTRPHAPTEDRAFGTARSVLQQPPSAEGWSQLCHALDAMSEDALWRYEAYLTQGLVAWPDSLRALPERWMRELVRGQDSVKLLVVRRVELHKKLSSGLVHTLTRSAGLQRVSIVSLAAPDRACIRKLTAARTWTNMRYLAIHGSSVRGEEFARLLRQPHMARLSGLELELCAELGAGRPRVLAALSPEHLRVLSLQNSPRATHDPAIPQGMERLEALRALYLCGVNLAGDSITALASLPCWPALELLDVRRNALSRDTLTPALARLDPARLRHIALGPGHVRHLSEEDARWEEEISARWPLERAERALVWGGGRWGRLPDPFSLWCAQEAVMRSATEGSSR